MRVALSALAFTFCCQAQAWAQPVPSTQAVQEEIMQIEEELRLATLSGDAEVFERIFAPTFINTVPTGQVLDKTADIAGVRSGALEFRSSENSGMRVDVYGTTAVATFGSTDEYSFQGQDVSGQYRWTDVFVLMDGRWQLVAQHGTRVAD